jgi:hypothetical protein
MSGRWTGWVTASSGSKDTSTETTPGGGAVTHDDPASRPSRRGWPLRTQETTTAAGTHDHQLPQGIFRVLIALCVFLLVLALVDAFLVLYIVGRGQVREQQIRDTREQVRESLCDVLDGLPQGGVLDLTRDRLGCGPGMPLESYPPDIQKQLTPPAPRATQPATEQPDAAPVPPPAAPEAPARPPAPDSPEPLPGGADGPPVTSQPPPLSPPSQLRHLVCDLLPICPEGAP